MPVLNSLAKIAAKPIPKAVTPKVHGIIDYITVGIFFGTVLHALSLLSAMFDIEREDCEKNF
jgi:hypothetical protein